VRIAISYAMNRDEVNELIYNGLLTPRQYSPLSVSPNYYPKLSDAYIEYDPDKANELLDAAGYDKRDADGFRLWKDGSGPISFIIEGTAEPGSAGEDEALLMVKYLGEVGIKAAYITSNVHFTLSTTKPTKLKRLRGAATVRWSLWRPAPRSSVAR
jgi:peptide/nickel transport system substrate-binding protein